MLVVMFYGVVLMLDIRHVIDRVSSGMLEKLFLCVCVSVRFIPWHLPVLLFRKIGLFQCVHFEYLRLGVIVSTPYH